VDDRRAHIFDDLRGLIAGELYLEPLDRAPYAHDASVYEIDPLGVVVPRNEEDVVTVVRYAAEQRIPIHARGAATDTGGGCLGEGLVIDFSRHLRKVVKITRKLKAGQVKIKLGKHRLMPDRYKLKITAYDKTGHSAKPLIKKVTVK